MENPTPYPQVNQVLSALLERVQAILGSHFVGLYLYGSLATGDFNPHRSDIDFLVVIDEALPDEIISDLRAMHMELTASESKWAHKLEGAYLPRHALRRYDPNAPPCPTINEGHFYLGRQGSDWIIQRHILREQETIVAGHSIRNLIDPVQPADLRQAVLEILHQWWAPMLQDPIRLESPEYQPFAVLSMCRTLFLLEHGRAISKTDAARWAMEALDPAWRDLIECASNWRRGDPIGSIERTMEFIRFTIESSNRFEDPGNQ
jgi:predicted nucleotidyltransferase